MKYMTLTKIYYAMPESYEEMYAVRYHAPFTFHLEIHIKQYHREKAYPSFFYYTRDMLLRRRRFIRPMSVFYTW